MKLALAGLLIATSAALAACGSDKPAAPASASPTAYTWAQFAAEYQTVLATTCDDSNQQKWVLCLGTQSIGVESMSRAAASLPAGKGRADLQGVLDNWKQDYSEFQRSRCEGSAATSDITCIGKRATLPTRFSTIQAIVKRENR
ncbi:hypothetical protein AB0M22_09220 [Nocardia sp. NPDC051756]|uniref:hypothetical protein n=1 Tax=Nocardia sp. NPDC051756 TaxID=3154751 RepID=UPI00344A9AF5